MLNWIKKLFGKEAGGDGDYDLYAPKERYIYRYWDGQKTVLADPMLLWKKLTDVGQELSVHLKVAMSPMKDADAEHEKASRKVRAIFDVKPLSEGGLTEAEALELLDHFLVYCDHVKKNSKNATTPSPNPAIWQGSTSPEAAGRPTSSTSDFGSTATVPDTERQQPLPSASA